MAPSRVGLPMGADCAGYIAKQYCLTRDIALKRSEVDEGKHDMAEQMLRVQPLPYVVYIKHVQMHNA